MARIQSYVLFHVYIVILKAAYCVFVYKRGEREEEERENTVESNLNCVFLFLAVLEEAGSG